MWGAQSAPLWLSAKTWVGNCQLCPPISYVPAIGQAALISDNWKLFYFWLHSLSFALDEFGCGVNVM